MRTCTVPTETKETDVKTRYKLIQMNRKPIKPGVPTVNNALTITSSPRRTRTDRKFRRNTTEPTALPSINTNELNKEALYFGNIIDNGQTTIHIAKGIELTRRSLPTLSDIQHASSYDLPQFPKRTFPISRKNPKLAPIIPKRSGSLNNDSNDGNSLSGSNVLESRPIVLTKRKEESGKRLLEPLDKKEEYRRWHLSLQGDIVPSDSATEQIEKRLLNQETQKSELEQGKDSDDMRLECSKHLQDRTELMNDEKYKPYVIYRMPTAERKRIEDWLEDCVNARDNSDNQSDDEIIEVVNQTNIASNFENETEVLTDGKVSDETLLKTNIQATQDKNMDDIEKASLK